MISPDDKPVRTHKRPPLSIYNSLSRKKEKFKPIHAPYVGLYVCGPTVYGDPHLGHGRAAVTFDVVFRYLKHCGYKVRYVRNITDVGHLEDDLNETGEDKIGKKARLEKIEPMEVVHQYTLHYHDAMRALNCLPPSIEPSAAAHIPEQIETIQKIFEKGYAYESGGSVYFDLKKYVDDHQGTGKENRYGMLSGKILEDLLAGTRQNANLEEKKSAFDFALWKKAKDEHIMKWRSPWSLGFPGWHLECTAMSIKYLGLPFDIHGGGMDLKFPHHECEIAQSVSAYQTSPARYWMHNNLLTLYGQKMSKSAGNFIDLETFFSGKHPLLEQAYSPMTIRFLYLLAHYRSEIDFSNQALQAAQRGHGRLMEMLSSLNELHYPDKDSSKEAFVHEEDTFIRENLEHLYLEMSDDFNTAKTLAVLFELGTKINAFKNKQISLATISKQNFEDLKETYPRFVTEILGLVPEETGSSEILHKVISLIMELREQARKNKDYAAADEIRDYLNAAGVEIMDHLDGSTGYRFK